MTQEKELTESGLYLPIGYRYETEFEPFTGMFPVGKKSDKQNLRFFIPINLTVPIIIR